MTKTKKNIPIIPGTIVILILCWIAACQVDPEIRNPCETMLFGIPIVKTGLSRDICQPSCPCQDYTPKVFRIDELESLRSWALTNPFDKLNYDPYGGGTIS